MNKVLLLGAVALGGYWAYRNGWGALIGMCPPGYVPQTAMFPFCGDQRVIDYDAGKCGTIPFNQPSIYPKAYGCQAGRQVILPSRYPTWP